MHPDPPASSSLHPFTELVRSVAEGMGVKHELRDLEGPHHTRRKMAWNGDLISKNTAEKLYKAFKSHYFNIRIQKDLPDGKKENTWTESQIAALTKLGELPAFLKLAASVSPKSGRKSLSDSANPPESGKQMCVAEDDKIPADIQEEMDRADKLDAEGKYEEAQVMLEAVLKSAETSESPRALVRARIDLAECLTRTQSDLPRAVILLEACLASLPPGKDDKNRESALLLLADTAVIQGRVHEGRSLASEALESARKRNDNFSIGRALIELGQAEEMLGNLPHALKIIGEATDIFRALYRSARKEKRSAYANNLAGCLMAQSQILHHAGNALEMLVCITEAEQIFREDENFVDNLGRHLLRKCEILFGLGKIEMGLQVLQEATDIFQKIENHKYLIKCLNFKVRLAVHSGNKKEALEAGAACLKLAKEKCSPRDVIENLLQMAALYEKYDLEDEKKRFQIEANILARKHQDPDTLAQQLMEEAGRGKATSQEQRDLLKEAIELLFLALISIQIKGRRAIVMKHLAEAHYRLEDLPTAKTWLEQAYETFEQVGDRGGLLSVLDGLSSLEEEGGNHEKSAGYLEKLLEKSQGAAFLRFRAMAHLGLAQNNLFRANPVEARRHFDAAKTICERQKIQGFEKGFAQISQTLNMAEKSREAANSSVPEMLQTLRRWTDQFPDKSKSILGAWFHLYSPSVASNFRAFLGVKFILHDVGLEGFQAFAIRWQACGDCFLFHPVVEIRMGSRIIIPWEQTTEIPESVPTLMVNTETNEMQLFKRGSGQPLPEFENPLYIHGVEDGHCYLCGPDILLPNYIYEFFLKPTLEELVNRKSFLLPRQRQGNDSTSKALDRAADIGHLPVFTELPKIDSGMSTECEAEIHVPTTLAGKRALRRFMSDFKADAKAALTTLLDTLETAPEDCAKVSGKLKVYSFTAGNKTTIYPALIIQQ